MSAQKTICILATFGLAILQHGLETKGEEMSYGKTREFLAKHTNVVELSNADGARVAVCPAWQGRVMTSSCDGNQGASFGFVNRAFIEPGNLDERFNNYGAEDRMWLSPEGGRFSLWFAPGADQNLDHWYTAPRHEQRPLRDGRHARRVGMPNDPPDETAKRLRHQV